MLEISPHVVSYVNLYIKQIWMDDWLNDWMSEWMKLRLLEKIWTLALTRPPDPFRLRGNLRGRLQGYDRCAPRRLHLKATFHYYCKLQTWLQIWLSTKFAARFSTSLCLFATCFRHAFDTLSTFLSKTWLRSCCINLDVRSLLGCKQVCSWLSTCFRHVFDLVATCFRHAHASRKPGL